MENYIPKHARCEVPKHERTAENFSAFAEQTILNVRKTLDKYNRKVKKFTVTEPARNNFSIELSSYDASELIKLNMPSLLANRFVEAKCVFHTEDGAYFLKSDKKFLECFARRMAEKANRIEA